MGVHGDKIHQIYPVTDWAPSLPPVLSSTYVTIHILTAGDQHYYEPAEPVYISSGLSTLLIHSIKRSALSIPSFTCLRYPLSAYFE